MWHFHTVICYWRQTELVCCDCWCFLHDTLKTHDEWVSEWDPLTISWTTLAFENNTPAFSLYCIPTRPGKEAAQVVSLLCVTINLSAFFFFIYTMTALIKFSLSLNRQWYGRTCQWVRHCFRRSSWDNWETQAPLLL